MCLMVLQHGIEMFTGIPSLSAAMPSLVDRSTHTLWIDMLLVACADLFCFREHICQHVLAVLPKRIGDPYGLLYGSTLAMPLEAGTSNHDCVGV
jgi:hypothetical protein